MIDVREWWKWIMVVVAGFCTVVLILASQYWEIYRFVRCVRSG